MKYKHIIWDWNGTLLDDVHLTIEIVNTLLVDHNDLQLNINSYREVFDFPIIDYYTKVGFDFERESFESLCNRFIATYDTRVQECYLHTGAKATLSTLARKGNHSICFIRSGASIVA